MHIRGLVAALLSGAPAFAQAPAFDIYGDGGDHFGQSIAYLGDLDGDGHDDYAVGTPYADGFQSNAGRVMLVSGRIGSEIDIVRGESANDRFGWSLAALGDVDQDGITDLLIGAPYHDGTNGTDRGAAYVFSGGVQMLHKLTGTSDNDRLGWAVTAVGDVDGDAVGDWAVGEPGFDTFPSGADRGRARVFSGASHALIRTFHGEDAGDQLGYALARLGDLDGDGSAELLAGAPFYDTGIGQPAGRAYVLSPALPPEMTLLATGSANGGRLGHALAGGFDFDFDGVPDIAIGEPYRAPAGFPQGRVHVLSGATQGVIQALDGSGNDLFGWSLCMLDDADGDGRADLAVGAPAGDVGASVDFGWVNLFSGASWQVLFRVDGTQLNGGMGHAVETGGRLNSDLRTDLLCAADAFNYGGTDSGLVRSVLASAPAPVTYCTAKTNSLGCVPVITFTGCASLSLASDINVRAYYVLPNTAGILIWSLTPQAAPFQGGTLCVAPPIRRTPGQLSSAGMQCQGTYNFHFTQDYLATWGLGAGSEVFTQYWSRDQGFPAPQNSGLTNGLKFTVLP